MQHGQDVARVLVAAADSGFEGAIVLNLPTPATDMATIVSAIEAAAPESAGSITFDETPLPFPPQPAPDDVKAILGTIPRRHSSPGWNRRSANSSDCWPVG